MTRAFPNTEYAMQTGVAGMVLDHNVEVVMSDGLGLRVNVYRPEQPGRYPVVMLHGPYGKDTWQAEAPPYQDAWKHLTAKLPDLCEKSSGRFIRWEAPDPERWVPDGYVVVHADSRGSNASPGFLELFSPRHTEDYATVISWAARQPWSNGKVGLLGISYYAITQWQVAARQPEGLAAMIPWEGAFDHYREINYHGGIPSTAFLKLWFARQVTSNQHGKGDTEFRDTVTGATPTGDPLSPELLELNRLSNSAAQARQPLDGAYYTERTPDPSRIQVPILSVGNWGGQGLHGRGNIEGYLAAASRSKWLRMHTGDHIAPFYAEDSLAVQKRFFDHFLKGLDNGWDSEPPVQLAIRGHDDVFWRHETAWPLAGTDWQHYYLDGSSSGLSTALPSTVTELSFDALGDGLTFSTAPAGEDMEFTGPVKLKLWVKSSTADMDIFATLRLIDPDGRDVTFEASVEPAAPVSQGWLRVSHRALDPVRSTEYRPYHPHNMIEPMTPGEIYEVDVEIWATSVVVAKGYRLALSIQGKDWEFAGADGAFRGFKGSGPFLHTDRDPTIYGGLNTVATGGEFASYLLLPWIPAVRTMRDA